MKPRALRSFPWTLVVRVAPLLACASAHASVVISNESNGSNAWTLPLGTNLLAGTAPATAAATHEGSSSIWGTLTDGSLGGDGTSPATSVTPNNNDTVTFPLDLTGHPAGYNITSFDSYCAWGNSGRDNQDYTLQYSTVADPTTFISIAGVNNRTGLDRATHVRLTDNTGFLATGVHSIRIIFANNQENGYTGYREFVLRDAPTVVCVGTEANNNNAFFLPEGPNLLTGLTPLEATPDIQEGSSATWETVTDGSLGDYTTTATAVTPGNGDTLTYPLDLTSHPAGRDITCFDSFCAWSSNGRDDQNYTLSYSTVGDPTTFIPITAVVAHTEFNGPNSRKATHARVTGNGGLLATGVHSIRLTFNNQENGFTGFREFVLRDTALPHTIYESNTTNAWTLPAGTNLLSGATVIDPAVPANSNHGNGDVTGSSWSVLTDGSVGSAGNQSQSVAPLNDTSVVFSLDTSVNTLGYNLTSFDAYAAWGDSGRDNQDFTILYSTVEDPATFIPIDTISNHTNSPVNATHSRITPASGFLATHVGAVKFYFNNQENGYVGYREFNVLGSAVPLFNPLTWSGLSGSAGNADWVTTVDDNWKDGASSSPFNSLAPLTFDATGINTNISIPVALTADSLTFTNDNTVPYAFSGDVLTVTNGLSVSGSGSVAFGNSVQAAGLDVSGTGSLTLSADNALTGSATVSSGTLNLASDIALGTASLTLTGGTVNLTSLSPVVSSLSGTGGALFLGNPSGSGHTDFYVGDSTTATYAGTMADASVSATGSLIKAGSGTLTLTGANSYSGTTTVAAGELKLGKRLSLYNGNTASWTASNVLVQADAILSLKMGGAGEFTSSDVAALDTGGFDLGSSLSIDTTSGDAEISDDISGDAAIEKQGLNTLTLSGANTFTQGITVNQGALHFANPSGISIPSDLTVGNVTFDAYASMLFDDQFGPGVLLKFNTGPGAVNGKVQLRGTSQTVAGLESNTSDRIAIIQNDETSAPGYAGDPGPCLLTIDTAPSSFHSFHGIIRNQNGGPLSLVKTGTGTQELRNAEQVQSYGYSGLTSVEEGTLRINFGGAFTGFASDITIEEPATLNFHAAGGNYAFNRIISGPGNVVVDGTSAVILTHGLNSWTGGTTVDGGFLALATSNGDDIGTGDGPGQTCVGGAMDPSNVISLINTATLSLDNAAPLGNSPVLPEFAPSIHVAEGSRIFGGTNSVAFVSNITLDGGDIEITDGAATGGFNTNLAFVGTLVVGGVSTVPSEIFTVGAGANANASLGSVGLPGTTFQVADVTGDDTADLTVSSILKDVSPSGSPLVSPLVKTGPGTMTLEGANTYTGDTTVLGGELVVNGSSIADTNKLVLDGGTLGVAADETVGRLFFGAVQQVAGTYGSTSSSATFQDNSRFSGSGVLTVTFGLSLSYEDWALAIANPDDRDRTDDADGDGFLNIDEFLFGTSPIASNGTLSSVEDTGSTLIVRWSERVGSSSVYVLQESTTLETPWPTSAVIPTEDPDQTGLYSADYIRRQAVIPVDSVKKFVRVEATE